RRRWNFRSGPTLAPEPNRRDGVCRATSGSGVLAAHRVPRSQRQAVAQSDRLNAVARTERRAGGKVESWYLLLRSWATTSLPPTSHHPPQAKPESPRSIPTKAAAEPQAVRN